jgi:regulator of sirC expression with transglutaminase-like and TPR domain
LPAKAKPIHCRPAAYALFAAQVPVLDSGQGLLRAAVAMSMHELHEVDLHAIEASLDHLAQAVRCRIKSHQPQAILAHTHDVLFEEEGFAGNTADYYNPANSYVPAVLRTRRGLPITLTLVYKCVLERLGMRVRGINAPGHFLAGVEGGDGTAMLLIDPFSSGQALSRDEALERAESVVGVAVPRTDEFLAPATHRQWLARMLYNLQHLFAQNGRAGDLAAMLELSALLEG